MPGAPRARSLVLGWWLRGVVVESGCGALIVFYSALIAVMGAARGLLVVLPPVRMQPSGAAPGGSTAHPAGGRTLCPAGGAQGEPPSGCCVSWGRGFLCQLKNCRSWQLYRQGESLSDACGHQTARNRPLDCSSVDNLSIPLTGCYSHR